MAGYLSLRYRFLPLLYLRYCLCQVPAFKLHPRRSRTSSRRAQETTSGAPVDRPTAAQICTRRSDSMSWAWRRKVLLVPSRTGRPLVLIHKPMRSSTISTSSTCGRCGRLVILCNLCVYVLSARVPGKVCMPVLQVMGVHSRDGARGRLGPGTPVVGSASWDTKPALLEKGRYSYSYLSKVLPVAPSAIIPPLLLCFRPTTLCKQLNRRTRSTSNITICPCHVCAECQVGSVVGIVRGEHTACHANGKGVIWPRVTTMSSCLSGP